MSETITTRVLAIIAEVTRYPASILTLDASLEDDLGIDSVKQAEIFAVLARELGVQGEVPRGSIRTIQDVVARCEAARPAPVAAVTPPAAVAAPVAARAAAPVSAVQAPAAVMAANGDLLGQLRTIVARVTRYPDSLLQADADFEDDLGIDSVKQAEIMVAVSDALPAAKQVDVRRDGVRNLAALAAAIHKVQPAAPSVAQPPAAPPAPPAPAAAPAPVAAHGRPFEGRVALVTGSGRGIGRVIAMHLASLGATVIVNSFHSRDAGLATVDAIRAAGGRADHAWGSVANEAHVDAIFQQIREQHGRLDMLVCNASDGLIGPFDQVTPRDWDRAFRTCVTGTHLCAMRAAELMRARGGSIITMSTITAHRYLRGFGSQGVVKAAVESLTRYLACELAAWGIRTNCVSAGPVYGELLEKFPDADETVNHWEQITPGGELCRPEDVATVVEMLLDDRAARVNGAVWVVDNGVSVQIDGRFTSEPGPSADSRTRVMSSALLGPVALAR